MMTMITIFGKLAVIITSAACAVSAHPLTLQQVNVFFYLPGGAGRDSNPPPRQRLASRSITQDRSAACLRYQQTAADRSLRQTAAIMCVEKQKKNDVSGF